MMSSGWRAATVGVVQLNAFRVGTITIAVVIGFALTAAGQSTAEAIKGLEAAMHKELSTPGKGPGPDRRGEAERFANSGLSQIEGAVDSGEQYRIDEVLNRVGAYFTSEEVRQQLTALRAAMKKDREVKQAAQLAEMNAALKQASDAVRNARNPEDLDETLKNLSRYRNFGARERYSEEGRAVAEKVQSSTQFVRHWQDYLVARKNDNRDRCREALQNLTNNENLSEIMPRSQVVAELEKYVARPTPRPEPTRTPQPTSEPPSADEVAAIVSKAKTLDALPDIIKELRNIQTRVRPGYSSTYDPLTTTLTYLFALQKTYREFQAGFPTRIENPQGYNPDMTSPAVIPLRAQLCLLILPRYLGVSGDLMPQPTETISAYLQRIIDQAKKRGDSGLLVRGCEAQRTISGSNFFGPESNAVTNFSAAENQAAAGEFALAVGSYHQALRSGGDAVPAKLIGERLAAMKAQHPAEYEEGMKRFYSSPRWDEGPPGFGRSAPWPSPPFNFPPALSVPAATVTPAPVSPASSPASTPVPKRP